MLGPGRLHTLQRTLTIAGRRAALEEVVVPRDHAPDLPRRLPATFTEIVGRLGLPLAGLREEVSAAVTTMSEAVGLQCDRATALLCLTRLAVAGDGTALARQSLRIALPGLTCRFE